MAIFGNWHRFRDEVEELGRALGLKPTEQYASGLDMPFDLEVTKLAPFV